MKIVLLFCSSAIIIGLWLCGPRQFFFRPMWPKETKRLDRPSVRWLLVGVSSVVFFLISSCQWLLVGLFEFLSRKKCLLRFFRKIILSWRTHSIVVYINFFFNLKDVTCCWKYPTDFTSHVCISTVIGCWSYLEVREKLKERMEGQWFSPVFTGPTNSNVV